jgi:hypothetical protein
MASQAGVGLRTAARPAHYLRKGTRRRPERAAATTLVLGAGLLVGGVAALGTFVSLQRHAPQPGVAQAGTLQPPWTSGPSAPAIASNVAVHQSAAAPTASRAPTVPRASLDSLAAALGSRRQPEAGPVLARSRPVAIEIPAIGVDAPVGVVGRNPNGTIAVPPLFGKPSTAAWYRYSPAPGQLGPSVIVGHVDNIYGPAVFFRLGALVPGDQVEVRLADGEVAHFRVDGVRSYPKDRFPTAAVYGPTDFAALRLVTCGGPFDTATRQYVDNTVVFASLVGGSPPGPAK